MRHVASYQEMCFEPTLLLSRNADFVHLLRQPIRQIGYLGSIFLGSEQKRGLSLSFEENEAAPLQDSRWPVVGQLCLESYRQGLHEKGALQYRPSRSQRRNQVVQGSAKSETSVEVVGCSFDISLSNRFRQVWPSLKFHAKFRAFPWAEGWTENLSHWSRRAALNLPTSWTRMLTSFPEKCWEVQAFPLVSDFSGSRVLDDEPVKYVLDLRLATTFPILKQSG